MLLNDPPRSIVAALRSETGGDHDRVDAGRDRDAWAARQT